MACQDLFVGSSNVTDTAGLMGAESEAIAKAIPSRKAEFAAGRRAARMALESAELRGIAILQGEHRAPIWPVGIVGSISHDAGLAIAAVAHNQKISRLGIDLTEATDFPEHLRSEVLRTAPESAQSGIEARLTFSAKESVFKAFYPEVGRHFGFSAVEVCPDLSSGQFTVELRRPLGSASAGDTFIGQAALVEGRLLTLISIRA